LSNEPVLKAENISKQVSSPEGSLTILSDVSLSIAAGESIAIVGASGAGKSTLLALLAGLDLPTQGAIHLNGAVLTELDEDGRAQVRAESVGFVFQSFHLVPSLNALENVMLPLELAGRKMPRQAASDLSWVTSTRVVDESLFISNMSSITFSPVRLSRLPVGSSAKRTAGSVANARAMATRCFSPPDSCAG
jgi:predicted ABC-type transport system involved in lysophospholipase L1 biosynthesis ATPase subunit